MKKWTEVGKDFTAGNEDNLSSCFDSAVWHKTPCELSDSAQKAITAFCMHNKINATYVADYPDFDNTLGKCPNGCGFLGMQAHFVNGDSVKIYLIDCGTSIRVVCYDTTKRDEQISVGITL